MYQLTIFTAVKSFIVQAPRTKYGNIFWKLLLSGVAIHKTSYEVFTMVLKTGVPYYESGHDILGKNFELMDPLS
jgi:hypothetical protein